MTAEFCEVLVSVNDNSQVVHQVGPQRPNTLYWHTRCGQTARRVATQGELAYRSMCRSCLRAQPVPDWVLHFDPVRRINYIWAYRLRRFGNIFTTDETYLPTAA